MSNTPTTEGFLDKPASGDPTWNTTVDLNWDNISLMIAMAPRRVVAASTGNVIIASALENGDVIDGVALATGDDVLLWCQTAAAENGIYKVVASGAASRTINANAALKMPPGMEVHVQKGTVWARSHWKHVTAPGYTLGSTSLVFNLQPGDGSPAFAAYFSANQVYGAGYTTCVMNTELYDLCGGYNNGNGVFTAPVAGIYSFECAFSLGPSSVEEVAVLLTTTGRNYTPYDNDLFPSTVGETVLNTAVSAVLAKGDTASFSLYTAGGRTVRGTGAGNYSWMMGRFVRSSL